MEAKGLDYNEVAKLARFKSGNGVKATVTRGLPHFARLLVVLWDKLGFNRPWGVVAR
jgi:hypothetical protein